MKRVIMTHIKPKSFLMFDGWASSKAATEQLGFRHAPPVKHDVGFRDRASGFHSNDVESENARIKQWLRKRYGKLPQQRMKKAAPSNDAEISSRTPSESDELDVDDLDMYEYCYYCNIGSTMSKIMKGLSNSTCQTRAGALLLNI